MATVFLSYTQDSQSHRDRVGKLAVRLRGDLAAQDVTVVSDHSQPPGGPNEGWHRWSEDQAAESEIVLPIFNAVYSRCWKGDHPEGVREGGTAEAQIIRERIYACNGPVPFARVVLFDRADRRHIPLRIRGHEFFVCEENYDRLLGWIRHALSLGVAAPTVVHSDGWLEAQPKFDDLKVANCEEIRTAFAALLLSNSPTRILLIAGQGQLGKTTLTEELAGSASGLPFGPLAARLDLKSDEVVSLLSAFARELKLTDVYAALEKEGATKCFEALFNALEKRPQPTVLIFDSFDRSGALGDWILRNVLPVAARASWLRVVVAGREVLDQAAAWRHAAVQQELRKLKWTDWCELRNRLRPDLSDAELIIIHKSAFGDHRAIRTMLNVKATA